MALLCTIFYLTPWWFTLPHWQVRDCYDGVSRAASAGRSSVLAPPGTRFRSWICGRWCGSETAAPALSSSRCTLLPASSTLHRSALTGLPPGRALSHPLHQVRLQRHSPSAHSSAISAAGSIDRLQPAHRHARDVEQGPPHIQGMLPLPPTIPCLCTALSNEDNRISWRAAASPRGLLAAACQVVA